MPNSLDLSLSTKQTVYRDLLRFVLHLRDKRAKRYPFPTALTHYCRVIQGTNQILTQEFVKTLASELATRITEKGYSQTVPIVELGAGSGRLAHFLNATKLIPVPVIATDIIQGVWQFDPTNSTPQRFPIHTEWRQRPSEPCFPSKAALDTQKVDPKSPFALQLIGARQAVVDFKPSIVLCSWMPHTQNWPLEIAQGNMLHVREFHHIGEPGQCFDRAKFERFMRGQFQTLDRVSRLSLSTSDTRDDWGYNVCLNILEKPRRIPDHKDLMGEDEE